MVGIPVTLTTAGTLLFQEVDVPIVTIKSKGGMPLKPV
jgi:hypothetical protein